MKCIAEIKEKTRQKNRSDKKRRSMREGNATKPTECIYISTRLRISFNSSTMNKHVKEKKNG